MKSPASLKLSRKGVLGLVYVAISIVAVGLEVAMTQGQVQWFATVQELKPTLTSVDVIPNTRYNNGTVLVRAYLENPTSFNGLHMTSIEYAVFVSSTNETSAFQGIEVAVAIVHYDAYIPARGTLNLTYQTQIFPDVVALLYNFLQNHTTDKVTFTLIAITLQSPVGPLRDEYCIQTPGGNITTCPSIR